MEKLNLETHYKYIRLDNIYIKVICDHLEKREILIT